MIKNEVGDQSGIETKNQLDILVVNKQNNYKKRQERLKDLRVVHLEKL